ncbi:MAG: Ig-like domain-containing protein [Truepera sp.]|nr:Ig-like domain-containing protein [Truepera sp.]
MALLLGGTARLEAAALDARDNEVPGAEFEWSSSDTTVASTDAVGLVRAVGVGAATVTAASGEVAGSSRVVVQSSDPADHHAALTAGLSEYPFANTTVDETVGTLRLDLNPDAFPVTADHGDMGLSLLVAGSFLGSGRVVAFSGQDFLGPDDQATLLGHAHADRLLANAVRWAGWQAGSAPLRVLVDNPRIADALQTQGLEGT